MCRHHNTGRVPVQGCVSVQTLTLPFGICAKCFPEDRGNCAVQPEGVATVPWRYHCPQKLLKRGLCSDDISHKTVASPGHRMEMDFRARPSLCRTETCSSRTTWCFSSVIRCSPIAERGWRRMTSCLCIKDPVSHWTVRERKALACVWSMEKCHVYLFGWPFNLRTDHQALTTLLAHENLQVVRLVCPVHVEHKVSPRKETTLLNPFKTCATRRWHGRVLLRQGRWDFIQQIFDEIQAAIKPEEPARQTSRSSTKWSTTLNERRMERSTKGHTTQSIHMVRDKTFQLKTQCVARGDRTIVPLIFRVLTQSHEGQPGTRKIQSFCRKVW